MKTPLYSLKSYPSVYDPSEDSFLVLDALESIQSDLIALDPLLILELGSGSGIISTFVSQLLDSNPIIISTDINPEACKCTMNTIKLNSVKNINAICGPGLDFISSKYYEKIDIIIFNPPYVVTDPLEIGDHSRAWAGGINGRQVIDEIIPWIFKFLSRKGHFYLVTIKENNNPELQEIFKANGFNSKIIKSRKAGIEGLAVTCFSRV